MAADTKKDKARTAMEISSYLSLLVPANNTDRLEIRPLDNTPTETVRDDPRQFSQPRLHEVRLTDLTNDELRSLSAPTDSDEYYTINNGQPLIDQAMWGNDPIIKIQNRKVAGIRINGRRVKTLGYTGAKPAKPTGKQYITIREKDKERFHVKTITDNNIVYQYKPALEFRPYVIKHRTEEAVIKTRESYALVIDAFTPLNQAHYQRHFSAGKYGSSSHPENIPIAGKRENRLHGRIVVDPVQLADYGTMVTALPPDNTKKDENNILKLHKTILGGVTNYTPRGQGLGSVLKTVANEYTDYRLREQFVKMNDHFTYLNPEVVQNAAIRVYQNKENIAQIKYIPHMLDQFCMPMKLAAVVHYSEYKQNGNMETLGNVGDLYMNRSVSDLFTIQVDSNSGQPIADRGIHYKWTNIHPENNYNAINNGLCLFDIPYRVGAIYDFKSVIPSTVSDAVTVKGVNKVNPPMNAHLADNQNTIRQLNVYHLSDYQRHVLYGSQHQYKSFNPDGKTYSQYVITSGMNSRYVLQSNFLTKYEGAVSWNLNEYKRLEKENGIAEADTKSFAITGDTAWETCRAYVITSKTLTKYQTQVYRDFHEPIIDGVNLFEMHHHGNAAHFYRARSITNQIVNITNEDVQIVDMNGYPVTNINYDNIERQYFNYMRYLESETMRAVIDPTRGEDERSGHRTLANIIRRNPNGNKSVYLNYKPGSFRMNIYPLETITNRRRHEDRFNWLKTHAYDDGYFVEALMWLYNDVLYLNEYDRNFVHLTPALIHHKQGQYTRQLLLDGWAYDENIRRQCWERLKLVDSFSELSVMSVRLQEFKFHEMGIKTVKCMVKDLPEADQVAINKIKNGYVQPFQARFKGEEMLKAWWKAATKYTGVNTTYNQFVSNIYLIDDTYSNYPCYPEGMYGDGYCDYRQIDFTRMYVNLPVEVCAHKRRKDMTNILANSRVEKIEKGTILLLEWERQVERNTTNQTFHYIYGSPVRNKRLYLLSKQPGDERFSPNNKTLLCTIPDDQIIDL